MTAEATLADLIIESIKQEVFRNNQFNTKTKVGKATNDIVNFFMKALSDNVFVNRKAISYFGKMITEEEQRTGKNMHTVATSETYKMFAQAYTLAAFEYMHRGGFFTQFEGWLRGKLGSKGLFVWKQLFPFAQASWNWASEMMRYSPVGLAKSIWDLCTIEKQAEKMENRIMRGEGGVSGKFASYLASQNVGKGILGSMLWSLGAILGACGVIRVDDEDDKLKIYCGGDVYLDVTNVFGSSNLLAAAALVVGPKRGEDENYNFWDALKLATNTMFEDWIFTDIINTFRGTDTVFDWALSQPAQMLGRFIPNLVKSMASIIYVNKTEYTSNKVWRPFEQLLIQSVPGIGYAFPTKIDPYTGQKQVKYKLPWLVETINKFGLLAGVKIQPYNVSEVEKEAIALGLGKGNLTGRYEDLTNKGIKLSSSDIEALNMIYGKLNEASLKELMSNKKKYKVLNNKGNYVELTYSRMTDEQKKSVINRIMTDNASKAKIYICTRKGLKYYTTSEERSELLKLGVRNIYLEVNGKKGLV